jgi:hypothetical protein
LSIELLKFDLDVSRRGVVLLVLIRKKVMMDGIESRRKRPAKIGSITACTMPVAPSPKYKVEKEAPPR